MDRLTEIRNELKTTFDDWEAFLARRDRGDSRTDDGPGAWSIREVLLHLRAWQQITIARVEAALLDAEPQFPAWLQGIDPFTADEQPDKYNALILESNHLNTWDVIQVEWRDGYLRLLAMADELTFNLATDPNRYRWLAGLPLMAVLEGTLAHHQEHLAEIPPSAQPKA